MMEGPIPKCSSMHCSSASSVIFMSELAALSLTMYAVRQSYSSSGAPSARSPSGSHSSTSSFTLLKRLFSYQLFVSCIGKWTINSAPPSHLHKLPAHIQVVNQYYNRKFSFGIQIFLKNFLLRFDLFHAHNAIRGYPNYLYKKAPLFGALLPYFIA